MSVSRPVVSFAAEETEALAPVSDPSGPILSILSRHENGDLPVCTAADEVLDGLKARDFHANEHVPGVSIKTVSRSTATLLLVPRLWKLSGLPAPLPDSRSSAKARAWWRLPIA